MKHFIVALLTILIWPVAAGAAAPQVQVKDGNTIRIGETVFSLYGIDAPEFDQMCVDDHAEPWACGVAARDELAALIGGKPLRCDDKGADPLARGRRLAQCVVEGDAVSLNRQMAQRGFALAADPKSDPKGNPFKADIAAAREKRLGLWKGCFVAPADFRKWRSDAPLAGASCHPETEAAIRRVIFPEVAQMPAGCTVKGRYSVRARLTGSIGIFHDRSCASYSTVTKPQRWFGSVEDARAASFRRAFNCRPRPGKAG